MGDRERREYAAAVQTIRDGVVGIQTGTARVLEALYRIRELRLYAVRSFSTFEEWAASGACPVGKDAIRMAEVYGQRVVDDGERVEDVVRVGWRRAWYAATDDRLRSKGGSRRRRLRDLADIGVPAAVERQNARRAALGAGRLHERVVHVVVHAGVRVWTRSADPEEEEMLEAVSSRLGSLGFLDYEVRIDADASEEES